MKRKRTSFSKLLLLLESAIVLYTTYQGFGIAKLASILYGVEGVKNCHLLTPDEDVSVSATELPVLGTVTITEIGAGEA